MFNKKYNKNFQNNFNEEEYKNDKRNLSFGTSYKQLYKKSQDLNLLKVRENFNFFKNSFKKKKINVKISYESFK